MSARKKIFSPFLIAVTAVICATVTIFTCVFVTAEAKIKFNASFYVICYTARDDILSADAISATVSDYGGAGYVLGYGKNYYITIACYYDKGSAERVAKNLETRGLGCETVEIHTGEYPLQSFGARRRKKLYLGNLNTLYSLSELCYNCANGLDTGDLDQTRARALLADVKNGLEGLSEANGGNCFAAELNRLAAECDNADGGFLYSKNMRKLQLAIVDSIINIKLY